MHWCTIFCCCYTSLHLGGRLSSCHHKGREKLQDVTRWDKMRQDGTRWDKTTTLDCRLQSPARSPASLSVLTFEHFGHCFLMLFAMSCSGRPNLPLFRQLKMHSNVQGAFEQTYCSFFLLYHPILCSLASNFAVLLSKSKAEPAWQFRFEGSVKLPWVSVTSCLECLFHPFSSFFYYGMFCRYETNSSVEELRAQVQGTRRSGWWHVTRFVQSHSD